MSAYLLASYAVDWKRAAWLTALGVEITIRTLNEFMRYESTDRPRLFNLLD